MDELLKERARLLERVAEIDREIEKKKVASSNLQLSEYKRYGRQMILDGIGLAGQLKLKGSKVLVVGAGGLGAPAILYLAAAGVGTIGIFDSDNVDISNLHRQVIHSEYTDGLSKVESARRAARATNSGIKITPYHGHLDSSNALDVIRQYDIVLDCTDNVPTRYLLSDACVLAQKPCVSGSAIRYQGQLIVYNHNASPCYRCLHPKPPPAETVVSCADGGVLGVVPGTIGILQALEALKLILGMEVSGKLLMFDALSATPFRSIAMRGRKSDCAICGDNPSIKELQDYVQFCGSAAVEKGVTVSLLPPEDRIDVKQLSTLRSTKSIQLLDVREKVQYGICHLDGSQNIPLKDLKDHIFSLDTSNPLYVICRFGNDSQLAVQQIRQHAPDAEVKDIIGGLQSWSRSIDPTFPIY